MINNTPPNTSGIVAENQRGSRIISVGTERKVRLYGLYENELESVSKDNSQAEWFSSAGTGASTICLTLLSGIMFADSGLPVLVKAVCIVGIPLTGITAAIFFWMAHKARTSRETIISRIKSESVDIEHPTPRRKKKGMNSNE